MIRLTPIVKNLLIINAVVFVLQMFVSIENQFLYGILHPFNSEYFQPTQFLTHMFMHADIMHLFMNMIGMIFFGPWVESTIGSKRFLTMYFFCGIGAAVAQNGIQYLAHESVPMLGASGAVFGVLTMCALYHPNVRVALLFIPIPIKLKYVVIGYAVISTLGGLSSLNRYAANSSGPSVAHFAHLGGMLFALILFLYWRFNSKRR